MKSSARKSAKQRWPFTKKRVYPSGAVGWIVDARTSNGGERKTFETMAEAETFAQQCRITRENVGTSAFGNEELAHHGKTVQDAIIFYLDYLRKREKSIPLPDAISELVAARQAAGRSKRYCHDLELRLGRFAGDFKNVTVAAIDAKALDEWLAGLKVAPGTRNTFRRDVRTLFSFCEKRGYCQSNEAKKTERARDVDKAPEILTVKQAAALLECATDDVLPHIAIGLFAGLRAAELQKLDWSEVDLASGLIEVTAAKSKTSKRRLVRISENLAAWLQPLAQVRGSITPAGIRKRFDAIKKQAGFAEWPQNALRHSFASYHLAQHHDAARLALEMGNSPAMVFAHYRELVKPKDAEKYWQIIPSGAASKKVVSFSS